MSCYGTQRQVGNWTRLRVLWTHPGTPVVLLTGTHTDVSHHRSTPSSGPSADLHPTTRGNVPPGAALRRTSPGPRRPDRDDCGCTGPGVHLRLGLCTTAGFRTVGKIVEGEEQRVFRCLDVLLHNFDFNPNWNLFLAAARRE